MAATKTKSWIVFDLKSTFCSQRKFAFGTTVEADAYCALLNDNVGGHG
jgi:hypothetical protein